MQRVSQRAETKWYLRELIFVRLKTRRVYIISEFTELAAVASLRECAYVCERSRETLRDREHLREHDRDRGWKRFDSAIRFYACWRKNYTFASETVSPLEQFATTRSNRNPPSQLKPMPFQSMPFERQRHVCNLQWHNTVSAERVNPLSACPVYAGYICTTGIHKALSSLSARYHRQPHSKRVCWCNLTRPSIPLLPYWRSDDDLCRFTFPRSTKFNAPIRECERATGAV